MDKFCEYCDGEIDIDGDCWCARDEEEEGDE